ncbi:MAG TPA: ABC transporter permease [Thermoleophilaceae bacterium]|nr:ABC transporter permease [Thermoleophilaceae bacterium]
MRWLVQKDLRILLRSPLLVALLIAYPVAVSVLVGFALTRGPDKPRVAFLSQIPSSAATISLGGEEIDANRYADVLFEAIDPVPVSSREEALRKVRDGEVLGALIIPPDLIQKLQSGLEPGTVEVFYNAEDPVKREFVENTIKAQVQDANSALTERFTEVALGYLDLLVAGGEFDFLGRHFSVLGLEKSEQILRRAQADLPRGSPASGQIDEVIRFAQIARENLDLSDDVLASVGTPIRVKQTVVSGATTPLAAFAAAIAVTVSLMFVAVLLAAGVLALEREENAFRRLVGGLISRTRLLAGKAVVAAAVAGPVAFLMVAGFAAFLDLDFARAPLWALAALAGALAFGSLGLAIAALAREVRAASLLAFMVALPMAIVSLVPSGSVSSGLYDVIRVIAAAFPFKPTLDAMEAAIGGGDGGIGAPLAHLAGLALAFGAAARLALRRFD